MINKVFTFTTKVWLYEGPAAWHFVSLPKETSQEIDFYYSMAKKGWGSLPVNVTLGKTSWQTSIFPDKKTSSYLLPLKKEVREKESISVDDTVIIALKITALV